MDELTEKAVRGDKNALRALIRGCAGALTARIGPGIPAKFRAVLDVEDVLQVTFLQVIQNIGRFEYRGEGSFLAWVSTVAENNLRDAIRGLNRKKRQPMDGVVLGAGAATDTCVTLLANLSSDGKSPTRIVREEEARRFLASALADLPSDYACAVQLYDLEERSIQEVADKMGRSCGAVHMLRSRAYDQLREILIDEGRFYTTGS